MSADKDIFKRVTHALDRAGVPYMLTGSFASSFHGAPRATHDIDIVVELVGASLKRLLEAFPDTEYYVSEDAGRDAIARQSQFNVVDFASGWKIDLIVRKRRPFSVEEFRRRQRVEFLGLSVFMATAEDVILAKLEWAKLGESERQLRDVENIVAGCNHPLDVDYIRTWVEQLGVAEAWEAVAQRYLL
jgi:hypothetical protein